MRIGSLFSGIGGLERGLERAGVGHVVWQVESDEFCRRVLAKHWPDVERFDDVCKVGAATLPPVDLICGGFPCQDVSSAGNREGLAGERSGLWFEFARIVGELRPEWVVVENVASGAKLWVDAVVAGLGEQGYQAIPFPLSAADCGAPHLRRRVFVVGRLATYSDSASVNVPERREAGESEAAAHPRGSSEQRTVADTHRVELREQPGGATSGSREAESDDNGEARTAADSNGQGERSSTEHAEVGGAPEPDGASADAQGAPEC